MDDPFEHLDALHAEVMAAWEVAGDSLATCQASGRQSDVDRHFDDRRRAVRLSNTYHLEADLVSLAARSRLDGVG